MTTLALIRTATNSVVAIFPAGIGRVDVPDVEPITTIHAPVAGWSGSGYSIADVVPSASPSGKRRISEGIDGIVMIGTVPTWIFEDLPPAPPPSEISRRQFFQVLAEEPYELISKAEALAAVQSGAIPQAFATYIEAMPEAYQFGATMLLAGAANFEFENSFAVSFGAAQGWSTAQRADLWRAASLL